VTQTSFLEHNIEKPLCHKPVFLNTTLKNHSDTNQFFKTQHWKTTVTQTSFLTQYWKTTETLNSFLKHNTEKQQWHKPVFVATAL